MTQKDHCDDPHENLCWLDLETTGLDPVNGIILEVGIIITTKDLETVVQKSWVVGVPKHFYHQDMDPFVWAMHQENGLWAECVNSDVEIRDVSREATKFIADHRAKGSPLCGNTISFDRSFLKAQTSLLRCLHYRNIDVSTFKNVLKMHFPDVAPSDKSTNLPHRVTGDL